MNVAIELLFCLNVEKKNENSGSFPVIVYTRMIIYIRLNV